MKQCLLVLLVLGGIFALSYRASATAPSYLWLNPIPTPVATPPPAVPNKGVFYLMGSGSTSVPSSGNALWANTAGVLYRPTWASVEPGGTTQTACASATPAADCFDWTDTIDAVLAQLPAGKVAQIQIDMGAYGSPMMAAVCSRFGTNVPHGCAPWLANAGATGVTVHSDSGPNGSSGGFTAGTTLIDPDPANAVFVNAFKGLVHSFEAKYSGNSQIALVSIPTSSNLGGDLSLMITQSPPCPPPNQNNNCPEYYGPAWGTESGTTGSEANWTTYVVNADNALWDYEIATLTDQNIVQWTIPNSFPDITSSTGATDNNIRNLIFQHSNNNQPANSSYKYSISNEALQPTSGWNNAVSTVNGINGSARAGQLGAQMARSEVDADCTVNNKVVLTPTCIAQGCADMVSSVVTYGVPNGLNWAQVYIPDITNCDADSITCPFDHTTGTSLACISHAMGGP